MKISRKFTTAGQDPSSTVTWTKRSLLPLTLAALAGLASCASNRGVVNTDPIRAPEVPASAKIVGGGAVGFSYRAAEPGTLYMVDGNNGHLLASKTMTANEEFELDASAHGILDTARDLNASHASGGDSTKPAADDTYHPRLVLYFQPQPPAQKTP